MCCKHLPSRLGPPPSSEYPPLPFAWGGRRAGGRKSAQLNRGSQDAAPCTNHSQVHVAVRHLSSPPYAHTHKHAHTHPHTNKWPPAHLLASASFLRCNSTAATFRCWASAGARAVQGTPLLIYGCGLVHLRSMHPPKMSPMHHRVTYTLLIGSRSRRPTCCSTRGPSSHHPRPLQHHSRGPNSPGEGSNAAAAVPPPRAGAQIGSCRQQQQTRAPSGLRTPPKHTAT